MVWSFYVMTSWKQRQNDLTHRWGSMNFTQDETPRPQLETIEHQREEERQTFKLMRNRANLYTLHGKDGSSTQSVFRLSLFLQLLHFLESL